MQKEWFSSWFDTPYYHTLYKHRDYSEAALFIDNILDFLKLYPGADCWDLACGKGRHSIYLNQKGYKVVGTDLSEQSIIEANKSANDSLEFYQHDMRHLFRVNYFDAVFNLFTSFGYFEKKHDDYNVFHAIERSLKSKGIFVFDFLNAECVKNTLVPNASQTIDGITFHISKKIEGITCIKSIDFEDKGQHFHFEERVKLFDKPYFEELAKECGLSIKNVFGNYHLDNFDEQTSPRLILVLQKS